MKKHYIIEIILMFIILSLTALLIIDYKKNPGKINMELEKKEEKAKNEYLLGIGYQNLFLLENYFHETLNIKNATEVPSKENPDKICYQYKKLEKEPNFLTSKAMEILNEFVFTTQSIDGRINTSKEPYEMCQRKENTTYQTWIEEKTIASKTNMMRKELNIKEYNEDYNYIIFEIKYYQKNKIETSSISFQLQKEKNEWKIQQFWL